MSRYYFLAASLPMLTLGERPHLSFDELQESFLLNLGKKDFEKMRVFLRQADLYNVRALLLGLPFDLRGNFSEGELEEALLVRSFLPAYVFDFLETYETPFQRVEHFHALISRYFHEELAHQKGFLKSYLEFERQWRLVFLGLRAKGAKRDLAKELEHEDPHDPLVQRLLAQKEAFEPPFEYRDLKEKLISCGADPWEHYKMLALYRFQKIEELITRAAFSFDAILGYTARLLIAENWADLDEKKGREVLHTFNVG